MTNQITFDVREMRLRTNAIPPKLAAGLALVMSYGAGQVQNDARSNAPWSDQTGNARNGLFAKDYANADAVGIELYHTVPYGIYLETRWSGKYQIIVPTIQKQGPLVMAMVRQLMGRL